MIRTRRLPLENKVIQKGGLKDNDPKLFHLPVFLPKYIIAAMYSTTDTRLTQPLLNRHVTACTM